MKPKTAGHEGGMRRLSIPIETEETDDISNPNTEEMSGITPGACVMTPQGLRPVDTLRIGNRIVTRSAGAVPITRIERRSFVTRAIYIIAGSLGHYQRDRDTLLPASQCVLVRDWRAYAFARTDTALVPAHALVDGEFVRDIGTLPVSVIRVFCATPQVFYADGMELGTADATPWPACIVA